MRFYFNAFFAPILHRLIIPDCLAFTFQAQRGGLGQVAAARLQVAEEEIPPVDTNAKRPTHPKQAHNKRKTRTQKFQELKQQLKPKGSSNKREQISPAWRIQRRVNRFDRLPLPLLRLPLDPLDHNLCEFLIALIPAPRSTLV